MNVQQRVQLPEQVLRHYQWRNFEKALTVAREIEADPHVIEHLEFKCAGIVDMRCHDMGLFFGEEQISLQEAKNRAEAWVNGVRKFQGGRKKGRKSQTTKRVLDHIKENPSCVDDPATLIQTMIETFPDENQDAVTRAVKSYLKEQGVVLPRRRKSSYPQVLATVKKEGVKADLSRFTETLSEVTVENYRYKAARELGFQVESKKRGRGGKRSKGEHAPYARIHAHVSQHGAENLETLRASVPEISETTFANYVARAQRDLFGPRKRGKKSDLYDRLYQHLTKHGIDASLVSFQNDAKPSTLESYRSKIRQALGLPSLRGRKKPVTV